MAVLFSAVICLSGFALLPMERLPFHALVAHLKQADQRLYFDDHLLLLEDGKDTMNAGEVAALFATMPDQLLYWRYSDKLNPVAAYWIQLKFYHETDERNFVLSFIHKFNVNEADIFVMRGNRVKEHIKGGIYRKASVTGSSHRFLLPFSATRGDTTTLLMRLKNYYGYAVEPAFTIVSKDIAYEVKETTLRNDLLFASIFIVLGVYNLLLFFINRNHDYLYYVVYMLAFIALVLFQQLHWFGYVLPESPQFSVAIYFLIIEIGIAGYATFISRMCNLEAAYPSLYRLYRRLLLFTAAKGILVQACFWLTMNFKWSDLLLISGVAVQLMVVIYLLTALRKYPHAPGRWVLAGSVSLVFMIVITVALDFAAITGWWEAAGFESNIYWVEIGGAIEAVCFSLALGAKVKQTETDKQKAQADMLRMQAEHTETLEQEVKERTRALEQANKRLTLQKAEMAAVNANLEELIQHRTAELYSAIDDLIKRNKEIEDFSFITSHNLKSPVAQFIGLFNLLDKENLASPDNLPIIMHLEKATRDMHETIQDLNYILNIRTNPAKVYEVVSMRETIHLVLTGMYAQIKANRVTVVTNCPADDKIRTIRAYLISIFEQLLSNAIKFRSDSRQLKITIDVSYPSPEWALISISDNGIGVAVDANNLYKIFGMYQRMHTHTEGKGLGLYLVKTQVEALKGVVSVESAPDCGSTFTVKLPR